MPHIKYAFREFSHRSDSPGSCLVSRVTMVAGRKMLDCGPALRHAAWPWWCHPQPLTINGAPDNPVE
jgi:hypothetical protein